MLVLVLGGRLESIQARLVSLMVAMRKVESRHGQSRVNQLFQLRNGPAGRAERANDLGLGRIRIDAQDAGQGNVGAAEFRARHAGSSLTQ